ncbi:MAG: thioesterase domain-containing protein, partial [Burkholderiaceae bacterium]|nr:thioesterase domain-containing protein [Burkholderiaceae bacterium]
QEAVLIGFYSPASVPVTDVYRTLRQRLAPQMVPAALYAVDSFPQTDRGKLDRQRLLAELRAKRAGPVAAIDLSPFEGRIAELWEDVLGHRNFGRDSSFFEVGGTSLTVAALVFRLREAFGLAREQLTEGFAYEHPTLVAMASALARAEHPSAGAKKSVSSLLITLRRATDPRLPPLFCVASAGGTVGAYRKLAERIEYAGEILGIRDPYITGERDPTEPFGCWVERYVQAICARIPKGPYLIVAYSSAGAFGYEIARRLRAVGAPVGLLALIDPLGIDARAWWRCGWWIWRAALGRRGARVLARWLSMLGAPFASRTSNAASGKEFVLSAAHWEELAQRATTARGHLLALAALLELNSGLPLDLSDCELPADQKDAPLRALQHRLARVIPGIDPATVRRIAIQYELQAQAQRAYLLQPLDAPTLLVEPMTPYAGLLAAHLRHYIRNLRAIRLPLGSPDTRAAALLRRFGPLASHFFSMRDDVFTGHLARALDQALSDLVPLQGAAIAELAPAPTAA